MGTASLVATAIGILLLIVTAYVLAGGTLSVADAVATAEKDAAAQHEVRMRTSIEIVSVLLDTNTSTLSVELENTGSESIGDFVHTDVYLMQNGVPVQYAYGTGSGTWSVSSIQPDEIHPGYLDPGETMSAVISFIGASPTWIQITTPSGVSDSDYV
jgi:flagellar protein FlaF